MEDPRIGSPVAVRAPTPAELRLDAAVHLAGLAFAGLAGPALILFAIQRGGAAEVAGVALYVATMIAMFSFSALHNMRPHRRRSAVVSEWLRRLDHGAIYLKIAGTYTPFGLIPLGGGAGPRLVAGVWSVALVGFLMKLAAPRRLEIASLVLYLALGWAIVLVAGEAAASLSPTSLALLMTGGALYTLGVPFHLWSSLRFQNAIWHIFVLAATACMAGAVLFEIARL